MENQDDIKLSKSMVNDEEPVNAQFYRAYCRTEEKWIGNWNADQQVAINSRDNHKSNNSSHTVTIEYR